MSRVFASLGAISAALAVALGAFAAHGLDGRIGAEELSTFETAARYHMYHALAMLAIGLAPCDEGRARYLVIAGVSFATGTVLFSGSLYLLALTGVSWLGAVAPLGGIAFILGWLTFAKAVWQSESE